MSPIKQQQQQKTDRKAKQNTARTPQMWRALGSFQSSKQTQARLAGPVRPLHPACQKQSQRTRGQSFGIANRRAARDGTARERGAKRSQPPWTISEDAEGWGGEVGRSGDNGAQLFPCYTALQPPLLCGAGGHGGVHRLLPGWKGGALRMLLSTSNAAHPRGTQPPFHQERWCPKHPSHLTPLSHAAVVWGGWRGEVVSQAPSAPCSSRGSLTPKLPPEQPSQGSAASLPGEAAGCSCRKAKDDFGMLRP